RKTGLADPTDAGDRHETRRPELRGDRRELGFAPDERRQLHREVPGEHVERAQRWELREEPDAGQLEHPLRAEKVAGAGVGEVEEAAPLRKRAREDLLGRV